MELFPIIYTEKFTVGQKKWEFNILLLDIIKIRKSDSFLVGACGANKGKNERNMDFLSIQWEKMK